MDDPQFAVGETVLVTGRSFEDVSGVIAAVNAPGRSARVRIDIYGARRERAAPADAEEQAQLAAAWLEYAPTRPAGLRVPIERRARHGYARAIPHLQGLARTAAEKRVADLPAVPLQLPIQIEELHGANELHLSPHEIRWVERTWGLPRGGVRIGDYPLDLDDLILPNRGATRLLPPGVDVWSVKAVEKKGRPEVAVLRYEPERVVVVFDDVESG